jgi:hypothetical protein
VLTVDHDWPEDVLFDPVNCNDLADDDDEVLDVVVPT